MGLINSIRRYLFVSFVQVLFHYFPFIVFPYYFSDTIVALNVHFYIYVLKVFLTVGKSILIYGCLSQLLW